jgi:hypothetical protein
MNRQNYTERALLIAMTQRDMSGCIEEHSLMSSVCLALDASSNQMSLCKSLSGKFNLMCMYRFWNIINDWCQSEPISSPFSKTEMRHAIAEAFVLARRELQSETRELQ